MIIRRNSYSGPMISEFVQQVKNASRYSLDGLKFLLSSEFAARLEVYGFFWVLCLLIFLKVPVYLLVSTIVLFLVLLGFEALNTAVEVVIDRISPEISDTGKHAKDLGSFAVMALITANFVNLCYALSQCNWEIASQAIMTTRGAILVSFLLLILGLYCCVRQSNPHRLKWGILALCAVYLLGVAIHATSAFFTSVGFDESVIYHLRIGLGGAGLEDYTHLVVYNVIYVALSLFSLYFIYDLLGPKRHKISQKITHFVRRPVQGARSEVWPETKSETKSAAISAKTSGTQIQASRSDRKSRIGRFGYLFLILAIIINPFGQDIIELVSKYTLKSHKLSEQDFYYTPVNRRISDKKNIVFIFAESLERTYFNEDLFPDILPKLKALEAQSLAFTNLSQGIGANFTISGIIGAQCGTSMYAPSNGNTMWQFDQFLPNAVCMGDILKTNGYELSFLGGADVNFAGKGKFLTSHGFDKIVGKTEYKSKYPAAQYYNNWGLYDDTLFLDAYSEYLSLAENDKPFGLFLLTLDTHHPYGFISPSCQNVKYRDGKVKLLNSVKCADVLITDFVTKIQNSPQADNTLIVVMSDHLAHRNSVTDLLETKERRNLFMIIDPSDHTPRVVDRKSSTFDVGITVLARLGFKGGGLGFGRDLLDSGETLLEKFGDETQSYIFAMRKKLQKYLWNYPRIKKSVKFNSEGEQVEIGNRWLKLPLVLHLTQNSEIEGLNFTHPNPKRRAGYLFGRLPKKDPFLWIDECEVVTVLKSKDIDFEGAKWCAVIGNMSTGEYVFNPLQPDENIPVVKDVSALKLRP